MFFCLSVCLSVNLHLSFYLSLFYEQFVLGFIKIPQEILHFCHYYTTIRNCFGNKVSALLYLLRTLNKTNGLSGECLTWRIRSLNEINLNAQVVNELKSLKPLIALLIVRPFSFFYFYSLLLYFIRGEAWTMCLCCMPAKYLCRALNIGSPGL